MFDAVFKWAKLMAVLSVIPVAVFLCLFLNELRKTTHTVATVADSLPTKVDERIGKLQTDVFAKIDTLASKADSRIDALTRTADGRIGSIQKDLFTAVGDIRNDVNGQLTDANKSVNTLVTAYADVPKIVGARYEKDWASYFDCAKNKLCLQGQASDTLFAIRTTSRDTSETMLSVKKTLPQISGHMLTISNTFASDIPKITGNINGIATNINSLTKPRWYDRVIGYALNGAVIYRSINPVTNLAVTGAQVVSSPK